MYRAVKNVRLVRTVFFGSLAGLLVCLLIMPALCPLPGRSPRTRDIAASAEIQQLSAALTNFDVRFGRKPPGSLTLYEDGRSWSDDVVSRSKVRQIWPQFDFQAGGDLNGDGDTDDTHVLTGAECLVFFLGGLRDSEGVRFGFSKNPLWPFQVATDIRDGPFMEFDTERLCDVDDDGFCEYGDAITGTPYLYVCRERQRFHNEDLNVYGTGDSRNMSQVYVLRSGDRSFQIISAGFDGRYGVGGEYVEGETELNGNRRFELDNITSFASGRLGD